MYNKKTEKMNEYTGGSVLMEEWVPIKVVGFFILYFIQFYFGWFIHSFYIACINLHRVLFLYIFRSFCFLVFFFLLWLIERMIKKNIFFFKCIHMRKKINIPLRPLKIDSIISLRNATRVIVNRRYIANHYAWEKTLFKRFNPDYRNIFCTFKL